MNILVALLVIYVLLNLFAPELLGLNARRIIHFIALVLIAVILLRSFGHVSFHRLC